jgi:hypothetical protein|tara:strand:- start:180 stop:383 length:204 start_codon:yes stop_codon:yes gene_type:complete
MRANNMKKVFSSILIVTGLVLMAGSANDCDGACMETANTLGEMALVAGVGLLLMAFGAMVALTADQS